MIEDNFVTYEFTPIYIGVDFDQNRWPVQNEHAFTIDDLIRDYRLKRDIHSRVHIHNTNTRGYFHSS